MLDLKTLLKKYRINFRDAGKNVSRGNIVISCPFCNRSADRDRGEHLAVNVASGQYYCFRNPRHASNQIVYVLKALQIPKKEYESVYFKEEVREYKATDKDYSAFRWFENAEENEEAITYLESRLFSNPCAIAQQFDLRVSKQGEWAGRLIIPLTIGWTGRTMREQQLRYKAYTDQSGFFLHKHNSSSVMIFEGALDAMRVASVTSQFDVIGKCRMAISPSILFYLRLTEYSTIYVAPDATVDYLTKREELQTVRSFCPHASVKPVKMSEGRKDFCETPECDVRNTINRIGSPDDLPTLRY
jgi:hypothetical protein